MKKLVVWLLLAVLVFATAGCGQQKAETDTLGGWKLSESIELTEEAQKAFDNAQNALLGVNYSPCALLGTQLVSGTNYCFLCEAAVVYPDAKPYYALVYVYENLSGEAVISSIVSLNLGEIADSGEIRIAESAEEQSLGGWTVDRESSVKADGAVLHLASQLVSGTNHCVLCKGWTLCFVYENLEGKTEVLKTVPLNIAELSRLAAAE